MIWTEKSGVLPPLSRRRRGRRRRRSSGGFRAVLGIFVAAAARSLKNLPELSQGGQKTIITKRKKRDVKLFVLGEKL